MTANYLSVIYDLTPFGVYKIKNAIVSSDVDDGITIEVSFDGGASFYPINRLNTKFSVPTKSNGKIQVRIVFTEDSKSDIYKVKAKGFFQNLEIGTVVNFTKTSNDSNFQTTVGRNGQYGISLPRGQYDVWYNSGKEKITLMTNYNPEVVYTPTQRLDKESIVEGFFRDVPWAKSCIFDTFGDSSKMSYGSAIYDIDGDLSDGLTNRKCRYWAIGFD